MTDHASSPMVQAIQTIGGVITDLVDVAERLPVQPAQAQATARILDRLSEEISEVAAMLRGVQPQASGTAADPRVIRARELLAEHHQPLVMSPGDVRHLLARFQRRTAGLLDYITESEAGS